MSLPDLSNFRSLKQDQIDWLLGQGVEIMSMIWPRAMLYTNGQRAADGHFDQDLEGQPWLVFPEPEDVVFWQPRAEDLATWHGRAFALGEDIIDQPETYAFDCNLNIFASPLSWLQAKRDGVVIVDWSRAFDRLRDVPRVAVEEEVLFAYRRHMQPARLPEVFVIPQTRRRAA